MGWRELIAFCLIWCALPAEAQILKGVVKENEIGGSILAGIPISAVGANPTETRSDGQFTLVFEKQKAGDPVKINVGKAGYVVVNEIQLDQILPANPDAMPLVILLCRKGDREEMARRFYRLISWEAIEAGYQKKLKELQANNAEQISELRKKRDQQKAMVEKMAEQLAQAKPGQMSETYNQALRLFVDKRTDEALKILNESVLQQNLATARKQKEEAEKAIE